MYYTILAYSENFKVLVIKNIVVIIIVILLQITVAYDELLGRNGLLCFNLFPVIFIYTCRWLYSKKSKSSCALSIYPTDNYLMLISNQDFRRRFETVTKWDKRMSERQI